MKKMIFFLLVAMTASAELTRLPDEFNVVERYFSLTSTFDISTELGPFVTARKRFFSFTSAYDLEDSHQKPIATANSRFFSWGTVADVLDPEGRKIGWIEEEVFRIFPWAEYKVFNQINQLVAIAKMNFWGTHFELYHPDDANEVYATIERPFFRCCRDHWTVKIKNYDVFEAGAIDPRLLMILAIYQTDKDNRDRLRSQIITQLGEELDTHDSRNFD